MICGQQRKLSIWNESGGGVCGPCRYKAEAAAAGYVVARPSRLFPGETEVFKARIHRNWSDAKKALDGIVWHNRDGWEIRPVMVGALKGVEA